MDVEDVTHPNRMKIQYALKEEGLEITVCGSWVRISGENNPGVLPTSQKGNLMDVYRLLLKQNPLFHYTMTRNEFCLVILCNMNATITL